MALVTFNGTLISGLTADINCCCSAYNCYCYTSFTNYGANLVSRSRACYRAPVWNGSIFVFPDGQPCVPINPGGCTINYVGIVVELCSCPTGGGSGFNFSLIGSREAWESCTTISPPP
jgi:hypothetical protein